MFLHNHLMTKSWRRAAAAVVLVLAGNLVAAELRVASYNLKNYFVAEGPRGVKDAVAVAALVETLRDANADILLVCEIGGADALRDLAERLKQAGLDYPHQYLMNGADPVIGLGLLSRLPPVEIIPRTGLGYAIRPKFKYLPPETMPVQRGFLEVVFEVENYRLHVIMAHLKSRIFHPRYNQTDMRRYEARLLRHCADEILKAEPEANLLILGDLNDGADTDPLRTLRAESRSPEQRLYDLRPADAMGLFWTHWWGADDLYGRIDYLLVSHGLLPEISEVDTRIVHLPDRWATASDHRPVLASITTSNRPPWPPAELARRFPGGIRAVPPSAVTAPLPPSAVPAVTPAEFLTLCLHEVGTLGAEAPVAERQAILAHLQATGADLFVLTGVRDEAALRQLQQDLQAPFAELVQGADPARHLALIAKFAPASFTAYPNLVYQIKGQDLPIQRGFFQANFVRGQYRLHLFAADLKDRVQHPEFNQTDMRRYEGRQLRALINGLLKQDPAANLLVLGNLNDTCGMATVKEIYNRRFGIPKRLFDLRPLDRFRTSWTCWDPAADAYERLDYALATAALLPEVVRARTFIPQDGAWPGLSSHRPLVVTISCTEEAGWSKEELEAIFPHAIYAAGAAAEERKIGLKRNRASPTAGP